MIVFPRRAASTYLVPAKAGGKWSGPSVYLSNIEGPVGGEARSFKPFEEARLSVVKLCLTETFQVKFGFPNRIRECVDRDLRFRRNGGLVNGGLGLRICHGGDSKCASNEHKSGTRSRR